MLHKLVPEPGLWERITIVGASNPVGVINNPSRSWRLWKVVLAEELPESEGPLAESAGGSV